MSKTKPSWKGFDETEPYGIRQFSYYGTIHHKGQKWFPSYYVRVPRHDLFSVSVSSQPGSERAILEEWLAENDAIGPNGNSSDVNCIRSENFAWEIGFRDYTTALHFWLRFSNGVS